MTPGFSAIDHLHVHVQDRQAAEAWYQRVLGLVRLRDFEHWAADGGPLTLADTSGHLHIALFERVSAGRGPTIALRVSAAGLRDWHAHLQHELGSTPALVDHGESRSLYFTDPDGNGFEITSYEREGASHALNALLDEELAHSPEYGDGGALSSHLPMALQALAAMGAPEARLRAWAQAQFPRMPLLPVWPELQEAEQQIAEQLARDGLGATLARRLPALMPGCGGMAFHLLIRTAHAWESGHRGQIVRALAHWSLRSEPLPGPAEVEGAAMGLQDWLQALLALPPLDLSAGLISLRMQQAATQPAFQQLAPRLRLAPGLLAEIARWAAAAYAGSGNFTLLHALTGARAMSLLLPLLAPAARPAALRDLTRQLAAALLASRWRGEAETLPGLADWPALLEQAVAHDDEHAIKAVHAAWQLGRTDSDPVWRHAAARALLRH